MMRSLKFIIIPILTFQLSVAQTVNDVRYFISSELNGSARYTGMAGAFGALGGDLSAISFNPASGSVFLHSEFGASVNYKNRITESTYFNTTSERESDDIRFDHFGGVFVFNNSNSESPWTRVSVGINFQKIIQYDQKATVNGNNSNGIDNYFLHYADGLEFQNLPLNDDETPNEVYGILGNEQGFGAQQAFLGYQSYIINPFSFTDGNTEYTSNVNYNNIKHQLDIINQGWHRKTSLNLSGLYKNLVHLGFNLNFHSLNFNNSQVLFETNQSQNSPTYNINFENELITIGNGISAQFGALFLLKNIRLGVTYDSPQWIELTDETKQSISAFHYEEGLIVKEEISPSVTNQYDIYQIKIPSKTTLSFAYVFGPKGLFSIDYSNQNFANTSLNNDFGSNYLTDVTQRIASRFEGVNTLRVGGEYRIKDISFRAGFLNQNTVHSNTIKNNKALTFGIGLDFGASSLGISLVNYEQNKEFELFSEGLTDPYFLRQKITQLTISYNFKL